MSRTLNRLDPLTLKALESEAKKHGTAAKKPDGGGLYFIAEPQRSSWWRFDYRFSDKQKTLSVGLYPEVTLKSARSSRDEMRKLIASGIDPAQQRKAERDSSSGADSFETIALEWWNHKKDTWTPEHADRTLARLVNDVFPYIGKHPINTITALTLLNVIRKIEARGAIETAHRTNQSCDAVFAYAIATERCENNPATAIRTVLKPIPPEKHFARLKETGDIAALLRNIDDYKGTPEVRAALQLLPYTFVRPGELVKAEWKDINFDTALWTIPAHVKKQRTVFKNDINRVHLVPLSKQAIAMLREIHPLTGHGRYIFPNSRTPSGAKDERHITEDSLLAAIRRMGYAKDEMTAHGFRGIASTRLREDGKNLFSDAVIESQLAHTFKNDTQKAYDHAEYIPERAAMMQWWGDHLDKLKNGAEIIPIRKAS
jgi:integrase